MGKINVGGKSAIGDAVVGDVLLSKTFSTAAGLGLVGTMPNNGAVSITPSASAQSVAAGYHNGSGSVDGDADLVSANIKSGANIFGVAGDSNVVDTISGDAVAGEILATKKAWVDGSEVTGSMTDRTTGTFTGDAIAKSGNYLRFGIPGDAFYGNAALIQYLDNDWIEGNIKSGVDVFGKTGTYVGESQIESIQRGTGDMINVDYVDITISSVDLDNSIVLLHIIGDEIAAFDHNDTNVRAELTTATNLRIEREDDASDVRYRYEVIEFNSDRIDSIQKVEVVSSSSAVYFNETISTIDLSRSMIFMTYQTVLSSDYDAVDLSFWAYLYSTTAVRFETNRGHTSSKTFCAYVVEFI